MLSLPKNILGRESGVAILMVLGVVALLAATGAYTLSVVAPSANRGKGSFFQNDAAKAQFYSSVEIIKSNVGFYAMNLEAWEKVVALNKASGRMACIDSGSACPGSTLEDIDLANSVNGALTYSYSIASNGFNLRGEVCNSYNSSVTNIECPIKIRIRWTPFCDGASCMIGPGKIVFLVNFLVPADMAGVIDLSKVDTVLPRANTFR
jgi:hypothetical protein